MALKKLSNKKQFNYDALVYSKYIYTCQPLMSGWIALLLHEDISLKPCCPSCKKNFQSIQALNNTNE